MTKIGTIVFNSNNLYLILKIYEVEIKNSEFQFADVSCLICGYKNQYSFYQDYMSVVLTKDNHV